MSKTFWKTLAWLSVICGFGSYLIGWYALLTKGIVGGIDTEFFFYDAIAAFMLGVFFLIYSVHYGKNQ